MGSVWAAASGARPRGPARRVADRRHPISCAVASANARYGRKRRLAPLGRSSTICRQCLEAAHLGDPISPRYRSARRKTTTALPQRGGTSGTVPVQLHIHRPRHRAPPGSLAAILVAWRSTPNSTARRPAPTVPRACSRTQVRRVSYYSTVPASACQAVCGPHSQCADLQPLHTLASCFTQLRSQRSQRHRQIRRNELDLNGSIWLARVM